MPRNLRDFWVKLDVDGYTNMVERGPKRSGGGFSVVINVASHGEPMELLTISGTHLQNGKNRVIISVSRNLRPGEEVYQALNEGSMLGHTLVLEEPRECKCLRRKDLDGYECHQA